ncbi:MAG: hemH [Verrucomicrobiaceae bacterium]|nr:hemH [Verrucomicrobiaceae bacterium]
MNTAVILMNLGTPAAPTVAAIRRYLREFLSDRRVVEIPRFIWYPILFGAILPFRPQRLVHGYAQMWREFGDSPLRVISRKQVERLQQRLQQDGENPPQIRFAMTYGEPKLSTVVQELRAQNIERILVLPLYPQFSATSSGAIFDQVAALYKTSRDIPALNIVKHYHDHPLYIEALAQSVLAHWQQHGRAQKLLMSFHGIPKRNVELGDPYRAHCEITAKFLAQRLQLDASQWQLSFQSRLGRAEWLQPYTSVKLLEWGTQKFSSIDVICPAFATDCLETLEEIAIENRIVFQSAGGGEYRYIPCLNDGDAHIELLRELIISNMPR